MTRIDPCVISVAQEFDVTIGKAAIIANLAAAPILEIDKRRSSSTNTDA